MIEILKGYAQFKFIYIRQLEKWFIKYLFISRLFIFYKLFLYKDNNREALLPVFS